MVMADGDPQQMAEINDAISEYMPNAILMGCGWHIVNQGWKVNGPSFSHFKNDTVVKKLYKSIKTWIYSWMRPGYCETKEEYELSKSLLLAYLHSKQVRKILSEYPHTETIIVEFVRRRILVHEKRFLFFTRKATLFFDTITNSNHEGTNFGLKSHAASVLPSMSLTTSAMALTMQATLKAAELEQMSISDFSSNQHWSKLPTSGHLVTAAEGILNSRQQQVKYYKACRIGEREFHVSYDITKGEHKKLHTQEDDHLITPIPLFRRIRKVIFYNHNVAKCSCCTFERTGLPCIHIYSVFKYIDFTFCGFTHHDVALRWRSAYCYYAYNPKFEQVSRLISQLCKHDIKGPILKGWASDLNSFDLSHLPIVNQVPDASAHDQIHNYDESELKNILSQVRELPSHVLTDFGLEQSSYFPSTFNDNECSEEEQDQEISCDLFETTLKHIPITEIGTPRQKLKPYIDEFLSVLESHPNNHKFLEETKVFLIEKCQIMRQDMTLTNKSVDVENDCNNQFKGTVGIIKEKHVSGKRKFNTHSNYYN